MLMTTVDKQMHYYF